MTTTAAIYNTKGGMGKSALTLSVASYLSYVQKLRVQVIDFDPGQHSIESARDIELDYLSNRPEALRQIGWTQLQIQAAPESHEAYGLCQAQ